MKGVNKCNLLNEYKEIYKQSAELIPEWKNIPQLELAIKCSEGGPLYESYLSAMILKFWHIIDRNLYRDRGLYNETEAYDWYINAIMVVVNSKPWDNPESSVYRDPKAVEKIINTCVSCDRANWFQASNRNKRKINHNIGSIESLTDEYGDSFLPEGENSCLDYDTHKEIVVDYFDKKQYVMAIMIDSIINDIPLDSVKDDKSLVRLIKNSIRNRPSNYVKYFSDYYEVPEDKVKKALDFLDKMSDTKLRTSIENYVYTLRSKLKREINAT